MHSVPSVLQWRVELRLASPKRKQMSLSDSCKAQIYGTSNLLPRADNVPFLLEFISISEDTEIPVTVFSVCKDVHQQF